MKTDTIFYRLFQAFPGIFFELINCSPKMANDYTFSSMEVKQLAFRIDGVFLPDKTKGDRPIYFGEVQFQPDPRFYDRFFAEIFLYLSRDESVRDWRGAVIFPNRRVDVGNTRRYQEFFDSGRITRIYLDELEGSASVGLQTVELIVAPENTAIARSRGLIDRVRTEMDDGQSRQNLLELIETILIYKLPRMRKEEIEAMFSFSDLKDTQYFQDVREEGRTEGRILGKLESVRPLLELGLTVEQIATALNLDIEQVRAIASSDEP